MCSGPLAGKIILFTIPIILSGVLQLFFNAVDMIVVGRYSGKEALAAVGSTGVVTNLLVNLFLGFSVGAGVVVSNAIGAKRKRDIYEIVHTSVMTALLSGFAVGAVGFFASSAILSRMDTPSDVLGMASLYLKIIFIGMPANMLYNFGASVLRATGDTKRPLYYLFTAGIVNAVLNLIFVIGFDMDVAGVATATIISQTISAALVLRNLCRGNEFFQLKLREIKLYKDKLTKIVKIGLPAGLQASMFSLSNIIIQSSVNSFGSVAMAGNSAASNIEGFVYVIMNAFHQTVIVFAGQNMGAGKHDRITRSMLLCAGMVFVAGLVFGNAVYIFGRELLGIYSPDSLVAVGFGLKRLAVICRFYFLCGVMDVMTGALRGIGYSMTAMLISVFGVCIFRIIWVYFVFSRIHTLSCLYSSYLISWLLIIIANIIAYFIITRKLLKNTAE